MPSTLIIRSPAPANIKDAMSLTTNFNPYFSNSHKKGNTKKIKVMVPHMVIHEILPSVQLKANAIDAVIGPNAFHTINWCPHRHEKTPRMYHLIGYACKKDKKGYENTFFINFIILVKKNILICLSLWSISIKK